MPPPPVKDHPFNQRLAGAYGEFGAGSGVSALYLQTALDPTQLDHISLVSDIEGSEQWPVRNLFQRDVDLERVTHNLIPYLESEDKIRFFNPLTLTLLPVSTGPRSIVASMPRLTERKQPIAGEGKTPWHCLTHRDHYRIRWMDGHFEYGVLEWSDARTRLVAVDGQHRLSALKRMWKNRSGSGYRQLSQWRIPAVIVTFRSQGDAQKLPRLVDVVRNIFVYINTTAQRVSVARQILLSDESPSAICTQTILERSHQNDLRPLAERDAGRVPLLFYDWTGKERLGRRVAAPAAVKSVEELRDWVRHYILGCGFKGDGEVGEFSPRAQTALGIGLTDPLHAAFTGGQLRHADSERLRQRFRTRILPAIEHILQTFHPFASYVKGLRQLERDYRDEAKSDLASHAFDELRFGSNRADDSIKEAVGKELQAIRIRIEELKEKHLTGPIGLDIGMRGVMAAFGALRQRFHNPDWSKYGRRFAAGLNRLFDAGWLTEGRRELLHIAVDHNDTIVNYRFSQVPDALGAYLELLIAAYGGPWPKRWTTDWEGRREALLETLENTVLRGYKKQIRPGLKEEFPEGGKPLTNAVNRQAREEAARNIRRLRQALDRIKEEHRGC